MINQKAISDRKDSKRLVKEILPISSAVLVFSMINILKKISLLQFETVLFLKTSFWSILTVYLQIDFCIFEILLIQAVSTAIALCAKIKKLSY